MRRLLNIYNTFKSSCKIKEKKREKESLNEIVKGTKSVLTNKIKFKEYIHNYARTTEKYIFKTPKITEYPVYKKQSSILIPVKRKKINYYEDLNFIKEEKNNEEKPIKPQNLIFISPKESLYKKQLLQNINTLEISKKMFRNKLNFLSALHSRNRKERERYNSLFLDFFNKWSSNPMNNTSNKNESFSMCANNFSSSRGFIDCSKRENDLNTIEYINNNKYSELKYDDNIIYNSDYSKFINEKIEFIKHNKIENNQTRLESIFDDSNGKEIKLQLESVKIIFKVISEKTKYNKRYNKATSDKAENEPKKEFILFVPLYYAFLLCFKNFQLFKYILTASIKFSEDFEKISFHENTISAVLEAITDHFKKNNLSPKKNTNLPISPKKNAPIRKTATKNYSTFHNNLFGEKFNSINSLNSSNSSKNNNVDNLLNIKKKKKKEEVIHPHNRRNMNKLYTNSNLFASEKTEENENKNKSRFRDGSIDNNILDNINSNFNSYNEYIFLWETDKKTFRVTVQMPMIYFKHKTLKNEIKAFCEKNLFLYLYKINFINWDFYVLNFLFSIKAFRKIILSNYSLNKIIYNHNDIYSKNMEIGKPLCMNNMFTFKNTTKSRTIINERYIKNVKIGPNFEDQTYDIFNENIIINSNKNKVFNILNENNESYLFFYTNNSYNNFIVKLYSYLIVIEYEKLNPKKKWKYYLDFKQMKQLNEITKYESLNSFLPKIIKTDFQNGMLSMDFDLFHEFDIQILGYEKKNIIKLTKSKNKNNIQNNSLIANDLFIDIQFPFLKVEKIINQKSNDEEESKNFVFSSNKIDLDVIFLQRMNDYKMNSWSKRLLEIINNNGVMINTTLSNKITNKSRFGNNNDNNSPIMSKGSFTNRRFLKSISFSSIAINNK